MNLLRSRFTNVIMIIDLVTFSSDDCAGSFLRFIIDDFHRREF